MQIAYQGEKPQRQHETDAGADLCVKDGAVLAPETQTIVGTGTRVNIPDGFVGLVMVRSSLGFEHRVGLSNNVGVIDAGYQGEIKVALENMSAKQVVLEPGDRVAQLLLVPVALPEFVEVESFSASERGVGGFGSTGKGTTA